MREKVYNFLSKSIKEFNPIMLLTLSVVFLAIVGLVSYKLSSSYALFTDSVNGTKTIAIHYEKVPQKTILYTDGTLIINEKASNHDANVTEHGAVSKEYPGMESTGTDVEKYIFTSEVQQPWNSDADSITKVEIGQKIYPTSTAYWFYN